MIFIGTKAQLIKTAPVIKELDKRGLSYRLVYTGQHSETFRELEACFGIRSADQVLVPDAEADSKFSFLTWAVRFALAVIQSLLRGEWRSARWGLVHGDTASTLFSAIALKMARVPVVHIEAGLRSPRLMSPFPEELVRRLVSRMTALHLAPDGAAAENLAGARGKVVDTRGNTIRDVLGMALESKAGGIHEGGAGGFGIVSMHRNENLSNRQRLDEILRAVQLAANHCRLKFVLHPVTRRRLESTGWIGRLESQENLELLPRMDYPNFIACMLQSSFLLTDGGSNQEEAAMLGLPTMLLREETERSDGIGDSVSMAGHGLEGVPQFVQEKRGKRWAIRPLAKHSPSAFIVDVLEQEFE
nr:UDP-N-acetylglucosamine 2-epimerase [Lysobacter sp. CAU 1642]